MFHNQEIRITTVNIFNLDGADVPKKVDYTVHMQKILIIFLKLFSRPLVLI